MTHSLCLPFFDRPVLWCFFLYCYIIIHWLAWKRGAGYRHQIFACPGRTYIPELHFYAEPHSYVQRI